MKKIKIRLLKGLAGTKQGHRDTVRGLGLRRINSVSELVDTPEVRGMINRVNYLVRIES
jgi:large subunit ribosomal protein L30